MPLHPLSLSMSSSVRFLILLLLPSFQYCTSFLLPEAIIQLLLYRSSLRTTPSLLSPSEEIELHKLGEEKAREGNWVHEVIYARRGATRRMLPKAGKRGKQKININGEAEDQNRGSNGMGANGDGGMSGYGRGLRRPKSTRKLNSKC